MPFDPETDQFNNSHAGSIEQFGHQPAGSVQAGEKGRCFLCAENNRQTGGFPGPDNLLDGREFELRMETAGWKALVQWILSWQPDVSVLSPIRLRDRVMQKMQQGLKTMAGR